ncbi:hypothetical protein GGR50DRAFT_616466 [Xylaria sp. CBS 124048]|nr:hypothetical protein GGR50DRAFT_616466 [Xylaria sp. CBS 124048]
MGYDGVVSSTSLRWNHAQRPSRPSSFLASLVLTTYLLIYWYMYCTLYSKQHITTDYHVVVGIPHIKYLSQLEIWNRRDQLPPHLGRVHTCRVADPNILQANSSRTSGLINEVTTTPKSWQMDRRPIAKSLPTFSWKFPSVRPEERHVTMRRWRHGCWAIKDRG